MSGLSLSDKHKLLKNVPKAVDALMKVLPTINPLLVDTVETKDLHVWVKSLVTLILSETVDHEEASNLGQQLEDIESFQPSDLLNVQNVLHNTLIQGVPDEVQLKIYPGLLSAFSGLVGGFYIGKARRAAEVNMSAASKMGHDLKTPINAITGFSHVILKEIDGPITEYQKEDLTSIHEAGKKLLVMIDDLTTTLKQDARRYGIYPSNYNVSDLVAEVLANIHPVCAKLGHSITIQLQPDLGIIEGDASKMRWILLSLLLYLSRQGEEWSLSLMVDRTKLPLPPVMIFSIEGRPKFLTGSLDTNSKSVTSTDMINRDVSLATCWHFCESVGASLEMFDGSVMKFLVRVPVKMAPN